MSPTVSHADSDAPVPPVLVVEDQILVRSAIADFLREQGHKVVEAANAAEAIAVFHSGMSIGVMFTDREMPGAMDGLMLARWVHQYHPEVHVLLTSGRAVNDDMAAIGAFFLKPYSFDQIAACIQGLCGNEA